MEDLRGVHQAMPLTASVHHTQRKPQLSPPQQHHHQNQQSSPSGSPDTTSSTQHEPCCVGVWHVGSFHEGSPALCVSALSKASRGELGGHDYFPDTPLSAASTVLSSEEVDELILLELAWADVVLKT